MDQLGKLNNSHKAYVVRVTLGRWAAYVQYDSGEMGPLWPAGDEYDQLPYQRHRLPDENCGYLPSWFFECTGPQVEVALRTVNPDLKVMFLEGWAEDGPPDEVMDEPADDGEEDDD